MQTPRLDLAGPRHSASAVHCPASPALDRQGAPRSGAGRKGMLVRRGRLDNHFGSRTERRKYTKIRRPGLIVSYVIYTCVTLTQTNIHTLTPIKLSKKKTREERHMRINKSKYIPQNTVEERKVRIQKYFIVSRPLATQSETE